jgi:serine/threonine-protein kinase
MERLEGIGLEAFLATVGPLDPPEAVRLVLEVCEGLAEAHAVSLVHRDIKPANLFLARRPDGRSIVKILDFGIAKRLMDKRRKSLTNPARSLGSPWYMSPEQMMDPSRVDARTDIWSLGVLLFELLTNDHPFDGDGVPEVCAQVLHAPAPSIREYLRRIDPALDAIVRRCLEKDPDDRFPSVEALSEALLELAPPPLSSRSAFSVPRSSRRRHSVRPTLGSLAPLADKLHLRHTPWSGALASAGAFAVAGAVTWAVFALPAVRGVPAFGFSKLERLERLELPGDPVLNPGPPLTPLSESSLGLSMTLVEPLTRTTDVSAESPAATAAPEGTEPALTQAEIQRRAERYENWLRARGLKRVADVTTDVGNPY